MAEDVLTATVRMYRLHELGDCFLLSFKMADTRSHMLIDCGSFRNGAPSKARLDEIVSDMEGALDGNPIDVVVGTHQHNDHLSGFVHAASRFEDIKVNQVWLSWLDDPKDKVAQRIGSKHVALRKALFTARRHLHASRKDISGLRAVEILDDVLGFYGGKMAAGAPALPEEAVEKLQKLGNRKPAYLHPGEVLSVPGIPEEKVKVYVLGPPRESERLFRKDPKKGESYDHALMAAMVGADRFLGAASGLVGKATRADEQYPFHQVEKRTAKRQYSASLRQIVRKYHGRGEKWRSIDDDWFNQAESLALFLDSFTNNTSVVLAIELVESGKVLLFAADAQTGNWLSWFDIKWKHGSVTTDDLLARTVLYKVGHHGSHNATLVAAMERMNSPELVALIPVHKGDPNIGKANGWKMPAKNLLRRLIEKTSGRVLQMDGRQAQDCDPKVPPALDAWEKIGVKPKQTGLFFEITIRDQ